MGPGVPGSEGDVEVKGILFKVIPAKSFWKERGDRTHWVVGIGFRRESVMVQNTSNNVQ